MRAVPDHTINQSFSNGIPVCEIYGWKELLAGSGRVEEFDYMELCFTSTDR